MPGAIPAPAQRGVGVRHRQQHPGTGVDQGVQPAGTPHRSDPRFERQHRRGLAAGIASAGIGAGTFGVPLLACAKASELTGDLGDDATREHPTESAVVSTPDKVGICCVGMSDDVCV